MQLSAGGNSGDRKCLYFPAGAVEERRLSGDHLQRGPLYHRGLRSVPNEFVQGIRCQVDRRRELPTPADDALARQDDPRRRLQQRWQDAPELQLRQDCQRSRYGQLYGTSTQTRAEGNFDSDVFFLFSSPWRPFIPMRRFGAFAGTLITRGSCLLVLKTALLSNSTFGVLVKFAFRAEIFFLVWMKRVYFVLLSRSRIITRRD